MANATLTLNDTYGDGWNGATMDVKENGTNILSGITFESGYTKNYNFTVTEGNLYIFVWTAPGTDPGECYFNFAVTGEGTVILNSYYANGNKSYFLNSLSVSATKQNFTLTGKTVTFKKSIKVVLTRRVYSITRKTANFYKALYAVLDTTSFDLTGIDIGIKQVLHLIADTGRFILTGIPVIFKYYKRESKPADSIYTNSSKTTSSYTNDSKNSSTYTNENKQYGS